LQGDRGITWAMTPPEKSPIVAGQWWPADYRGPLQVSLDAEVAHDLGLGLGDTLTVNVLGREFTATVASLREIEWRTLGINFVMIFSPGPLEAAPRMHIAIVHAAPAVETELERAVTDAFPNVSAIRVRTALATVNDVVDNIGAAVRVTAGITLLAGTLVLAGAVAAGHRRRIYDSVVLKVLGATRRNVLTTYALEYGLLGLTTATIAAVLGSIAAWAVLTFVMGIDSVWLPAVVAATGLGCMLVTMLAGFAGTWRALGHKAAPLLRNE
jgi:putative ABC transport system permease protein